MLEYVWLIPFFPMVGAVINGLVGNRYPRWVVNLIACGSIFASFVVSVGSFIGLTHLDVAARFHEVSLFTWIGVGSTQIELAYLMDPLSAVMCLIVTGVGFLIHVYSVGYMAHDSSYPRFFTYLNLFCFAMLTLVLGNNFLVLFVGWEGVGLCSYLLIGFWFEDQEKAKAGMKAFVANRVGDFGFLLAMFLIFTYFGTLNFREIMAAAPVTMAFGGVGITAICLLLFLGATGKSAQIPLFVWLPDAMAGPTPVSALIHAATMVTAGVYMMARCNVLFSMSPTAMATVATIGAVTAIFAGTIALTQNDIKKVLAYSTVSQLGYMFLAVGSGAFVAAIFHMVTHAFFKALMFLCAGSVIHGCHHEQDMRKMGGLRKYMPHTYRTFLVSTIAIAGLPPLAAFFSKDEILWLTWSGGFRFHWFLGFLAAGITAFYMFRLVIMTFFGEERHDEHVKGKVHESPPSMYLPLYVLAGLSIVGGWVGIPEALGGSNHFHHWLAPVLEPAGLEAVKHAASLVGDIGPSVANASGAAASAGEGHGAIEYILMVASVLWALTGIAGAYFFYVKRPDLPGKIAAKMKNIYELLLNKYYIDEIYQAVFINGLVVLGEHLWRFWDVIVVDGAVNSLGRAVKRVGGGLAAVQTGQVQGYALAITLGAVALVAYVATYVVF